MAKMQPGVVVVPNAWEAGTRSLEPRSLRLATKQEWSLYWNIIGAAMSGPQFHFLVGVTAFSGYTQLPGLLKDSFVRNWHLSLFGSPKKDCNYPFEN